MYFIEVRAQPHTPLNKIYYNTLLHETPVFLTTIGKYFSQLEGELLIILLTLLFVVFPYPLQIFGVAFQFRQGILYFESRFS